MNHNDRAKKKPRIENPPTGEPLTHKQSKMVAQYFPVVKRAARELATSRPWLDDMIYDLTVDTLLALVRKKPGRLNPTRIWLGAKGRIWHAIPCRARKYRHAMASQESKPLWCFPDDQIDMEDYVQFIKSQLHPEELNRAELMAIHGSRVEVARILGVTDTAIGLMLRKAGLRITKAGHPG